MILGLLGMYTYHKYETLRMPMSPCADSPRPSLDLISALGCDEFGDRQAAFASMMVYVNVAASVFTDLM